MAAVPVKCIERSKKTVMTKRKVVKKRKTRLEMEKKPLTQAIVYDLIYLLGSDGEHRTVYMITSKMNGVIR